MKGMTCEIKCKRWEAVGASHSRTSRKEGNFSCQRIMQEAGISVKDVSVRTVSRFLNAQGYYYLQVHKKGVLTVSDMKA